MADRPTHRGPHPEDDELFSPNRLPQLQAATADLSWLLTRGYSTPSSLKLVGDRHRLALRQRTAVSRCSCSDHAAARRQRHQCSIAELSGQDVSIDGYNLLIAMEVALSGGAILLARDGCYRDMASLHGSYRSVEETVPAILLLGEAVSELDVASCRWLLDQPVSNSGRLKTMFRDLADQRNWSWDVEVVPDPDPILRDSDDIVATADSQILDHADRWFNLARYAIDSKLRRPWVIDLSVDPPRGHGRRERL